MRSIALLLITTFLACDGGDKPSTDPGDTNDTTGGTDTDTDDTMDTEVEEPPSDWTLRSHSCVGSRTDTLLIASDGTWWVGCGTTTEGTGLFMSTDEGATWSSPTTTPSDYFSSFRVIDVWEDAGRIYASGDYNGGGDRSDDGVVSFDPADGTVDAEFVSMGQIWNTFLVGTYRQTSGGFGVAESNNGTDIVYRTTSDGAWQDGSSWRSPTLQILDLQVHNDQFYGVGSTIADNPKVFLPPAGSTGPGTELAFTEVILSTGFDGEMWSLHVDDDGIFVGGVDQDGDVGKAYLSGSDPYDPDTWTEFSLDTWYPGTFTWVEGVCRRGDTLVMVGRISNLDDAIVMRSADAGETWEDITPDAESAYRCNVLPDERIVIAGKDGLIGIWDPQ